MTTTTMHPRVLQWFEEQLATFKPCEEAPGILMPDKRLYSGYLPELPEDEEDDGACDDEVLAEYPWDLDSWTILYLDWNRTMGAAGGTSYEGIAIPGLATFFVELGFDGRIVLGAWRGDEPGRGDQLFLDALLRTNGRALHADVIGSVPCVFSVGIPVNGDWLVDRLICAFDDSGAWASLLEECPWVWDANYEEPPAAHRLSGADTKELHAEYDALRPSGGMMDMMIWSRDRNVWMRRRLGLDKPFEPIHEVPPRGTADQFSNRNKWRMLERWLSGPPEGMIDAQEADDE